MVLSCTLVILQKGRRSMQKNGREKKREAIAEVKIDTERAASTAISR